VRAWSDNMRSTISNLTPGGRSTCGLRHPGRRVWLWNRAHDGRPEAQAQPLPVVVERQWRALGQRVARPAVGDPQPDQTALEGHPKGQASDPWRQARSEAEGLAVVARAGGDPK